MTADNLQRDWARPTLYRVTRSDTDTVRVGSTIVDDDNGDSVRAWHIYNPVTGSFAYGWTGERLLRLCRECIDRATPLARPHGHDHPHGDGPMLDIAAEVARKTPARTLREAVQ